MLDGAHGSRHAERVRHQGERAERTPWYFRRVTVAVGGATVVLLAGWTIYNDTLGYWPRLEKSVSNFSVPAGFERVGRVREGTTFCVISCNEARITMVLRTPMPPQEACEQLRTAVDRQIEMTETPSYLGWCGWQARLDDVGEHATVTGGAEPSRDFMSVRPGWAYASNFEPPSDGTVAWIEFSSGID